MRRPGPAIITPAQRRKRIAAQLDMLIALPPLAPPTLTPTIPAGMTAEQVCDIEREERRYADERIARRISE